MSWGGTQINLREDQLTRANYSQGAPVDTFIVRTADDAVKPFHLVKLDGTQIPPNKYIVKTDADYGDGVDESFLFVVEPRLFRPGATEFYDKSADIEAGQSVNASLCVEKELYVVRANTNTTYNIGEIVVPVSGGEVGKLTTAGVTADRVHAFGVVMRKTTTSNDRLILVRYLGLIPATNKTLAGLVTTTPFFAKTGAGAVGTMNVIGLPIGAPTGTITYASSNESVATVNSSGAITAVGNGTAYITATSGTFKAVCIVTVSGIA